MADTVLIWLPDALKITVVIALAGLAYWLSAGSDDDDNGGGLMQPVLVPVRSGRR